MTDIIGVMCTPSGRFPPGRGMRGRKGPTGTTVVPRILLYNDFSFSFGVCVVLISRTSDRPSTSIFPYLRVCACACMCVWERMAYSGTHAYDFVKSPKLSLHVAPGLGGG